MTSPKSGPPVDARPVLLLLACVFVSVGSTTALGDWAVYPGTVTTVLACAGLLRREGHQLSASVARSAERTILTVMGLVGVLGAVAEVGAEEQTFLRSGLMAALMVGGGALLGGALLRRRRLSLAGAVLLVLTLVMVIISTPVVLDVLTFHENSAHALLQGQDPYTLTFPNRFSPEETTAFYGPGLVVDGRIVVGYPYPPVSLLLLLPGFLMGDVRIALWVAVVVATLLVAWHTRRLPASSSTARPTIIAAALLLLPGLCFVLLNGWTEPLSLVLLAATVVAGERRWRSTPYLLGTFLVTKQYLLVTFPLLWLLLPLARQSPGGTRRFALQTTATGLVWTLPFVLWNPDGFWDSVVAFQFRQPYRPDSFSLVTVLSNVLGARPGHLGIVTLAVGLAVALLLALRAPRTPAGFAASLGVTMFVTFLFSTQAFANYYLLGAGSLVIAVACWGDWDENARRDAQVNNMRVVRRL